MRLLPLILFLYSFTFISNPSAWGQQNNSLQAGIEAFETGKNDQARGIFKQLQKQHPDMAEPAYYLGRIAMLDTNHDAAMKWFEKAADINANEAEYQYWLSNAIFIEINNVGALKKMRYSRKGKAALDKCVSIDPDFPECHLSLSNFYYMAPGIAGGDKDKSWVHAKRFRDLKPAQGSMFMAQRYADEEEFEKSEQVMTDLLTASPDDPEALRHAGMYYLWQQQFAKAFELFDRAITIAPQTAFASYYQLGKTAVLSGQRTEDGLSALNKYMDHQPGPYEPSHASAHWRMGMLYENTGDKEAAKASYKKALDLEPNHRQAKEALNKLG